MAIFEGNCLCTSRAATRSQVAKDDLTLVSSSTTDMSGLTLGDSTERETPSLPHPVSSEEARHYYAGLPSKPILIARTGRAQWEAPRGPEAYLKPKELRIVGVHEIEDIWEDDLAPGIHAILEQKNIDWSSTDVVRMGYVGEPSGDVILWIGVRSDSISYEVAIDAAVQCKSFLLKHGINDIEVEMRRSEIVRSAGPQLFPPVVDDIHPMVDVCRPFTFTLGNPISAQHLPWIEGSSGFYLGEGGDSERLLLVTARHVLFLPSENEHFECRATSQTRRNVVLMSNQSFQDPLDLIDRNIKMQATNVDYETRRVENQKGALAQMRLDEAKAVLGELQKFYLDLKTYWATESSRTLGHVIFSPPILVGAGSESEQYTQDVAVIEIDSSKIDQSRVLGNVIDLGTKFSSGVLTAMMCPNCKNAHKFTFPDDRLLRLQGTIDVNEMRKPTTYDQNDEPCLMVMKVGRATGLTIGRANNILSFTRTYFGDNDCGVSKEWAILPFDSKSGAFSEKGDSGAVVVDGRGRIGGLLTGGGGQTESMDVSYVTPIEFVMRAIRSNKSLANVYPRMGNPA